MHGWFDPKPTQPTSIILKLVYVIEENLFLVKSNSVCNMFKYIILFCYMYFVLFLVKSNSVCNMFKYMYFVLFKYIILFCFV
jgi:hypothetical protein